MSNNSRGRTVEFRGTGGDGTTDGFISQLNTMEKRVNAAIQLIEMGTDYETLMAFAELIRPKSRYPVLETAESGKYQQ